MPPGDFSPLCFPQPPRSRLPPLCNKCRFTRLNHEYRQSCQSVFQQYLRREKKQVVGVGGVQMQLVNVLSKPTVFMSQWSWQSVSLWTLTTRVKTEDESSHTSLSRVSSRPTMAGFLMIEIEGHTAVPSQTQIHIEIQIQGFVPCRQGSATDDQNDQMGTCGFPAVFTLTLCLSVGCKLLTVYIRC